MSHPDGGPAFPGLWVDVDSTGERVVREAFAGMSLRQWYAGMALQGMLSHSCQNDVPIWKPMDAACRAYEMADAMLQHRERQL